MANPEHDLERPGAGQPAISYGQPALTGHKCIERLKRGVRLGGDTSVGELDAQSSASANRKNMTLLVQLCWTAVLGQIATMLLVELWLGIKLPLGWMSLVIAALAALNMGTYVWMRCREEVSGRSLLIVLTFDVAALTAQLWLSGGAINPFTSLFLLQVALGAVLLDAFSTWVIVLLACMSVIGLTFSYRPLMLPHDEMGGIFSLYIEGMLACFVLDAILLVIFVTRMSRNLRERDAHLAALRQHAAEESHIVRMGLLATGAAHELGTPLASLAVILGDWRHMPVLAEDEDMSEELAEMQAAIQRCKAIVTGILLSAGEARGEASEATTLNRFFGDITREWRGIRSANNLSFKNLVTDDDIPVAFDATVKQAIFNVLDNAYEASPEDVRLSIARAADILLVRVSDKGSGFDPDMLQHIGKPYQSSKESPGSGLGLFLVVNVVRKLGGTVTARNLPDGGAEVCLKLPLSALSVAGVRDV